MERAELQLSRTSFFLKSIKKIREKFEKIWNIFEKIMIFQKIHDFSKKSKISKILKFQVFWFSIGFRMQKKKLIFKTIFNKNIQKFSWFSKIVDFFEKSWNFQYISDCFNFLSDFFMDFKKKDVVESWSSALHNNYYVYLWNMLP